MKYDFSFFHSQGLADHTVIAKVRSFTYYWNGNYCVNDISRFTWWHSRLVYSMLCVVGEW